MFSKFTALGAIAMSMFFATPAMADWPTYGASGPSHFFETLHNTDSPSFDIARIEMTTLENLGANWTCANLCHANGSCDTYTVVLGPNQPDTPVCWLKRTGPGRPGTVPAARMITGIAHRVMQFPQTDMPGNDIARINLNAGENAPNAYRKCVWRCTQNGDCNALTFVPVNLNQESNNHHVCWLKSTGGSTSGHVRRNGMASALVTHNRR